MTKTVLCVEDQPDNVVLIQRILARRPHVDLVIAGTGTDALRLARQTRPALILLDRRLPDMFGEEVLTRIRADESTAHTAVVILSGDTSEQHRAVARAAGVDAYLSKPFEVSQILDLVDRYCAPEHVEDPTDTVVVT